MPTTLNSHRVAVIGAGAAGLAAARELHQEGHNIVVFERNVQIGGTWVYDPQVESDPLGLDPSRTIIHSSLYSSLRTNLPREAMGFRVYPFIPKNDETRDSRRYPSHREVMLYLQDFAREFGIEEMVKFETEVVNVALVKNSNKWKVRYKKKRGDNDNDNDFEFYEDMFDAVVVCNGHYTQPRIAGIPGIGSWPGKQLHSHNYRVPEPFRDQVCDRFILLLYLLLDDSESCCFNVAAFLRIANVVVLIGSSTSAREISREIAGVAKEVHVASRSVVAETHGEQPGYDNMWCHSMIQSVHEDGSVVFRNGRVVLADTILHCTGYKYHFPFLETNGIVTVDDDRVGPLYKHVFPPVLAPSLSFVGLPWKVFTFRMFEFQSKWIAGVLSGRIVLPSQEEMMKDIEAFYLSLEASSIPKRYTHDMDVSQYEYYKWIAAQCGCEDLEEWRKQMHYAGRKNLLCNPENFRDVWEDDDLILDAIKDLTKCNSRI